MEKDLEWVCPYCNYMNKGGTSSVISGTQIGGSFEDLTKTLSQSAEYCSYCGRNRLTGEKQVEQFNPREKTGCIIALVLIISIPFLLWLFDIL
jgi:DNA-directed RNA polymerase subunit RPC12/RpoP